MCINPAIFSLIGLVFDIVGFILISCTIIIPPKIGDGDVEDIQDAFGVSLYKVLNSFKKDVRTNIGFWLIILGFMFQFVGTLLSIL